MISVRVLVTPKEGVLDPQGKAVETALARLGFSGVSGVRQGKLIELALDEDDPVRAESRAREMCEALLANPVIETYRIEIGRRGVQARGEHDAATGGRTHDSA